MLTLDILHQTKAKENKLKRTLAGTFFSTSVDVHHSFSLSVSALLGAMGSGDGELGLSEELMAVLPPDPIQQLELARRITARAVASRASKLEAESVKLKQKLKEKEHLQLGLQARLLKAQSILQETDAKIILSMDEQAKLSEEKTALALQVRRLFRDVAKLETFKRTLVQSLQEEDDRQPPAGDENRAASPQNLPIWKASQVTETPMVTKAQVFEDDGQYAKSPNFDDDVVVLKSVPAPRPRSGRTSARTSARGTPKLTPTTSPPRQQQPSRKGGSLTPSFPSMHSSLDSHQQIHIPMSLPTSRSSSPNRSRTSRVDGKQFFRQARSRLTYEQFSGFLANIKELNAHRQTREETLDKAAEIFGPENIDLYNTFESILSRHMPT